MLLHDEAFMCPSSGARLPMSLPVLEIGVAAPKESIRPAPNAVLIQIKSYVHAPADRLQKQLAKAAAVFGPA
jgi:hypothetical protein